jgi:hypothetical protein
MSLNEAVEAIIKEAMERGEFENLRGQGKPLDLSAYIETPEELRLTYTALKNAGMIPEEISLLQEIAALREQLRKGSGEEENGQIRKIMSDKLLKYNILLERRRR